MRQFVPRGRRVELPREVPYYSQFCSPELILPIIRGEVRAEDDPRWAEFGARDREEYAHWSWKACGIASLKMAVEALGVPARPMMEWIEEGVADGAFLSSERAGEGKPSGWIHKSLVEMARRHGLEGECVPRAVLEDIAGAIDMGKLVIASVSHELGEWGDIAGSSGHLVVAHGYSRLNGAIEGVMINNPSGRFPELRRDCWLSAARFAKGFSGRLIVIRRPE